MWRVEWKHGAKRTSALQRLGQQPLQPLRFTQTFLETQTQGTIQNFKDFQDSLSNFGGKKTTQMNKKKIV